jgi:transcriptional regulator with GAF, ATPase, and Fis domain
VQAASALVRGGGVAEARPVVIEDGAMQRLHRLVERVAAGIISVLLLGETGVGKEVFAEAIHSRSPRSGKPFLKLNCAALTESLLESELFGHERGAFTGAVSQKPGLLETADGGTVFLDEVGELPASLQAKLLRVLEEKRVLRVGGTKSRVVDVRFIAATNRDLESEVDRGRFRRDLYFRLNGISLVIPPLRDRRGEIEPLARAFLRQACSGRTAPVLGPEVLARLQSYAWPGNIRELRNVMERAAVLAGEGPILAEHLPVEKMGHTLHPSARYTQIGLDGGTSALSDQVAAFERRRIIEALERCAGNQTKAARLLGMSRRTLVSRLRDYDIPRPRKGR